MAEAVDLVAVSRHLEGSLRVPPLIRLNGKKPLDTGWTTGPRRRPDEWRRRLVGHGHNVGMVTGSGLVVIDVDPRHPDAAASFDRLRELGLPTETVTQLTGGGGRHYLYRCPLPIRSGPLEGFGGIDVKAEGGQIVVAPSIHPVTGEPYDWEYGWGPDDLEPLELPEPILALLAGAGGDIVDRELDERDEQAVTVLVERFGGHDPHPRKGYVEVMRPGKVEGSAAASVGALGPGVVKVWSSNWDGLPAGVYGLGELKRLAGIPGPKFNIPTIKLPEGFRLWRPGDDDFRPPTLGTDAYHGPVGDFLHLVEGQTEAHPAAIGFSVLTYLGCWLGRSVTFTAGDIVRHHPALWGAIVGPTSTGGKGMAWSTARTLLDALDPKVVAGHTASGFGSGQALVAMLRDDDEHPDKSYVVHDHELSSILRVSRQEGSILSETLRKAFDLEPLENRTREHGELVATGYFVGALASITVVELRALLDELSIENGLGNRFLWLWSELVAKLPYGGRIDEHRLAEIVHRIGVGMAAALEVSYPVQPGTAISPLWESFYDQRRHGIGDGIVRSLTSRHHAHVGRLATVYAAIDGAVELGAEHLRAAIAWCDYSAATVEMLFGTAATGDAGKLLVAIRKAGSEGLDGTAQRDVFHRNRGGDELDAMRADLHQRWLIHTIDQSTAGRPRRVSYAISPIERTSNA